MPPWVGLFYDMSSGDKALKMGPNKGKEGRNAARTARIVIGGTAGRCREKERKKGGRRGEVGMREPGARDAVFHPHLSLCHHCGARVGILWTAVKRG